MRVDSVANKWAGMCQKLQWRSALIFMPLLLHGCASAPRGPANSLADAGIATTGAIGSDVRDTAARVRDVDVSDTFVATYDLCKANAALCASQLKSETNVKERASLAEVIELRAAAVAGLGKAYRALKTEASYDARGDLVGATNEAIDGVNSFAAAVKIAAPAALIGEPLKKIIGFGAGLIAENAQRKRLMQGSAAIRGATKQFRDALAGEAFVFDSLAGYIEKNRTAAKLRLIDSGLVSRQKTVAAFADTLGMTPVGGVDAVLAGDPAAGAAVRAVIEAQSRNEVARVRAKYRAALAALDALVISHTDLETSRPVSLADVDRFIAELDAALAPATGET